MDEPMNVVEFPTPAPPTTGPIPIDTHVELHDEVGLLGAVHFTKLVNGNLQISVAMVSPNAATAVTLDKEHVPELIRKLIFAYMIPPEAQ